MGAMYMVKQLKKILILTFSTLLFSKYSYSYCLGWSSLAGYQIIESHTLRKFDCPIGGKYDCLQWPQSFYEWGSKCVELPGYYGYGDEAILMSNGTSNQMVTIGLMNSPECHSVKIYNCPSRF